MIDFIIRQRIKKRESDILFNKNTISRLEADLKRATDELWKRQLQAKISQLKADNETMERKNLRKEW
jgi:hypothetical protein